MSSDKDKSEDATPSFEKTSAKIGGQDEKGKVGPDNDFNFSDIPILGSKGDKDKKVSFSFDSKKNIKPQPKEQGLSSFEAILRDQINQPKEKAKEKDTEKENTGDSNKDKVYHFHKAEKKFSVIPKDESHQNGADDSQSKWDNIASGKKSGSKLPVSAKTMIIISVAVVAVLGVFSFFLLKSKTPPPQGAQTARTAKTDPKAEEKAKRLASLEEKLAYADAARKESKFDDALKTYQSLMNEGWNEKEPAIFFGAAECNENMSLDDEAVSNYIKAIDAGWKDNAQPYVRISKLLNKSSKYSDSITYLKKARDAFPSDTFIGAQLAESYYLAGQIEMAVTELKKSNRNDLSLDMLKLFAQVRQKNNESDQARDLYAYGMKKFNDLDCFTASAALSENPQDKIEIMTQAVGVADDKRKGETIMHLAELLVQAGRKDDASKQLDKISLDQLKPESATIFLKMLVNFGNLQKFSSEYRKATESYPKNFGMHRTVFEALIENGMDMLALDTYREWWNPAKEDPVGGYFYAKSLRIIATRSPDAVNENPIPVYRKVTELNSQFPEALLELGHLYTMGRNWTDAEHAYSECVRIKPDDRNARNLLAMTKERAGKGEEAIAEYEKYIETLNLAPEEKAAELIDLAQKLEKSGRAEKYLAELGKNPKRADAHRVQTMKFKLIYGKPNDEDFADPYPKAGRKFHVYYLLSKGRNNEILLMPVPPDEFPDFWKLFILWKNDKPGWQDGMEELIAKNKGEKDATYRIIADIWNGKTSPDDARKLLTKVHPDNEPLFFLMLAEKYRKDKIESKAKVCYLKALSERQTPLAPVIDFYSQIPIK